jgi:hypothetical protein
MAALDRRRALTVIAALASVAAGSVWYVTSQTRSAEPGEPGSARYLAVQGGPSSPFRGELLVWAFGGFSEREVALVADSTRVAAIASVRTGYLRAASGSARYPFVPVETMAADSKAYASALGRQGGAVARMLSRGVVLSRTGAELRRLRVGDRLQLSGGPALLVSGLVDDALIGGYEAALDRDAAARYGLRKATYLLLRPRGTRAGLEAAVRKLIPGRALRFRVPGERPYLRAGDGVLPLGQVKARFGQFAMRASGSAVAIDPHWVQANIVRGTVPVLGAVRCHRRVMGDLAAAMTELEHTGLAGLVDVGDFHRHGGCFNARTLRGGNGELSRHAWGIAVDLNVAANPLGARPRMDRRLVQVMARHGFTWGGSWLRPDGGHFEWVGPGA